LGIAAVLCSIIAVFMAGCQIQQNVVSKYQFEKAYGYAWSLADKSSTIEAKAKYIAEFVEKLESNKADFSANNAVWLKTPDNSFDMNLAALKTLNGRLHEIMTMDVKSFEYQTAISQITAQEQGEAHQLINVVFGCWVMACHPIVWEWFELLWMALWVIMLVAAVVLWIAAAD